MRTYEEKVELDRKNGLISNNEILQDIQDTLDEIRRMKIEITAFELLGDKMSMFKAENRRIGIKEREEFVEALNDILEIRYSL